jgi:hypothetical protein
VLGWEILKEICYDRINRSINQAQSISKSVDQSINQSISQSVNQSLNKLPVYENSLCLALKQQGSWSSRSTPLQSIGVFKVNYDAFPHIYIIYVIGEGDSLSYDQSVSPTISRIL